MDDAAELKRAQIRMAIRSIERKASKAGDLLANAEDLTKFSSTVFRNVDVDSTRFVEFGELRVCLEEICALFGLEKPSQEDVETSMKDLDKDMNGKVSSDEFEALIKQVLEGMQVGDAHGELRAEGGDQLLVVPVEAEPVELVDQLDHRDHLIWRPGPPSGSGRGDGGAPAGGAVAAL